MKARIALVCLTVGVLSGCTPQRVVSDLLADECHENRGGESAQAAKCMTAAIYEIARKKEQASKDEAATDSDNQSYPRTEHRTP